jgi:hypothetical protein
LPARDPQVGDRRLEEDLSFYVTQPDGTFASTPAVVGPWDPGLAHGSPPAALLAHAIERAHPRPDLRLARIAYDFHGVVPAAPVSITTEIVRPGARIELARATLTAAGRVAMEARVWRIAAGPDRAPEVPDQRALPPFGGEPARRLFGDLRFGYGEALEWRFAEGAFHELGPATVWARPRISLVDAEAASPIERLLLMVDSANGISAELPPSRFTFVPVELTVSVRRHPRTDWVGMRARTFVEPDGIGQTQAELFDEDGWIGVAVQTLFVGPRT